MVFVKVNRWFDVSRWHGGIADSARPCRILSRRQAPGSQTATAYFGHGLCFTIIVAMTMMCACASSRSAPDQPAAISAQPQAASAQPEGHIYVTSEGLSEDCYQDLGQVAVNESFAQSVVETPDSQAQRLRDLAREKYSPKVDAVINVRAQQNDAGTAVEITGEAVHIQNHQTIACAARGMPDVVDSAAATAAGGIVGTVIGGLAVGNETGAEAGGGIGAGAAAGMELARHRQQEHAREAFISDRLGQQQTQIKRLSQQLTGLIQQQCDTEQLSEQDCDQRISGVRQQVGGSDALASGPGGATGGGMTDFQIQNRVQEQQELIDRLQQRIAEIKRGTDQQ